MLKKIGLLFLLVFTSFIIVGCDENLKPLDAPKNLQIDESKKILSWDAVKDATEYIVYANDSIKATVKDTKYDFSNMTETRIVFKVVAVGTKEFAKSGFSVEKIYEAVGDPTKLGTPKNLRIDDAAKKLSWDAVTNATEYVVYANNKQIATTKETNYNFSSMVESEITFTVVAIGSKGFTNSDSSSNITYLKNKEEHIKGIEELLKEIQLPNEIKKEFITELVNKGVSKEKFAVVFEKVMILIMLSEEATTEEMYKSLQELLKMDINFDAYISASLKIAKPLFEDSLTELEENKTIIEQEISLLQKNIADQQPRLSEIQNEIIVIETEIESINDQEEVLNQQINQLYQEIDTIYNNASGRNLTEEEFAEINQIYSQINELQSDLYLLWDEKREKQQQISELYNEKVSIDMVGYELLAREQELQGVNLSILGLEAIINALNDSHNDMVKSLAQTTKYFVKLQTTLDIDKFKKLIGNNNPLALTPAEIALIISEFANWLEDGRPTQDELVMMLKIVTILMGSSKDTKALADLYNNLLPKLSKQMLLTSDYTLKFIKSLDVTFFNKMQAVYLKGGTEIYINTEIGIIVSLHLQKFYFENQALMTEINNVLTETEKKELYDKTSSYIMTIIGSMTNGSSISNYEVYKNYMDAMQFLFDKGFKRYGDTSALLVRKIVELESFYYDGIKDKYVNLYTGNEYTISEYNEYKERLSREALEEMIAYYIATIGALSNDQVKSVVKYIHAAIPIAELAKSLNMSEEDAQMFANALKSYLDDAAHPFLNLLTNLGNYLKKDNNLKNILDLIREEDENTITIIVSKHISTFFTNDNKIVVKKIFHDFVKYFGTEEMLEKYPMLGEIKDMDPLFDETFQSVLDLCNEIKDYDSNNLTPAQLEKLEMLLSLINKMN